MRYKLIAEVEGNVFISENISVEARDSMVEFLRNARGKLECVSVSKPVPNDKLNKFAQALEPGTGSVKFKISIGGDEELHNELVKELQVIESNLAFATQGLLQRIRWDNPEQEYVPDNIEEEKLFSIRNVSTNKQYERPNANITHKALVGLIELSPKYQSLSVAKSFWREGMVYFNNFQYVQAFYQFYFVIEDFYISGKTSSKKSVMKKFQESKELLDIANTAMVHFQNLSKHKDRLDNFLTDYKCAHTAIGLLEMLYEVRNNLHHFHSRSTKTQGTPFNQSDFDTIALLGMYITKLAISFREVKISQSLKENHQNKI